jgi:hypothetical protein
MKTFKIVLVTLIVLWLANCGSSNKLSDEDIQNISTAFMAAFSDLSTGYVPNRTHISFKTISTPINAETACPVSGRITATGNFIASFTDDEYSTFTGMNGLVTFYVSDPTNNLNDCEVGNGIILDGTLTLTMTMNAAYAWEGSLVGTIGINKRGPTGGLVPITDDCSIFLSFTTAGATGTICGQTVN